jgi:hypothetical protein
MNNCVDVNDTVPLDSLLRYVLPTIPALPNALGVDLLRDAWRDMMARTESLSSIINLDLQKDVDDYEITPPDGYVIHRIREVGYRGDFKTRRPQAHYWYTSYDVAYRVVSNNTIILRDMPSRDDPGAFQVRCALVPDECITRIPREVSIEYGKGIAAGAVAQALEYPTRPWYNPSLAAKKQKEYENAIRMAKNTTLDNRGGADQNMRGRRWV